MQLEAFALHISGLVYWFDTRVKSIEVLFEGWTFAHLAGRTILSMCQMCAELCSEHRQGLRPEALVSRSARTKDHEKDYA